MMFNHTDLSSLYAASLPNSQNACAWRPHCDNNLECSHPARQLRVRTRTTPRTLCKGAVSHREHTTANKLPARHAFRVRAAVCNDARNALGSCPQNGDMFWYHILRWAPDARNCVKAHISCAHISRARTHQRKQTPCAARIPRARRRLQRRANRARTFSPKR